jgi:hypothetical protein
MQTSRLGWHKESLQPQSQVAVFLNKVENISDPSGGSLKFGRGHFDPAFLTFGKSVNVITSLNMVVLGMIRSNRQVVTGLVYPSDLLQVRTLQIIAASL